MEIRSKVGTAVTALVLLGSPAMADVDRTAPRVAKPAGAFLASNAPGILTERLTEKQLRIWERIRDIVFTSDSLGRPQYPTLQALWLQAATSGHRIYVELADRRSPGCAASAGTCRIERLDPEGVRHTIVIRLDLNMIDRAHVGEEARRLDGFIPLQGLRKEQRYAEVLGHELAHAVRFIRDAEYRRLYEDLSREAREYLFGGPVQHDDRTREERAFLRSLLEGPAEAAEVIIWRELTGARPAALEVGGRQQTLPNQAGLHRAGAALRQGGRNLGGK